MIRYYNTWKFKNTDVSNTSMNRVIHGISAFARCQKKEGIVLTYLATNWLAFYLKNLHQCIYSYSKGNINAHCKFAIGQAFFHTVGFYRWSLSGNPFSHNFCKWTFGNLSFYLHHKKTSNRLMKEGWCWQQGGVACQFESPWKSYSLHICQNKRASKHGHHIYFLFGIFLSIKVVLLSFSKTRLFLTPI